LTIQSTFYRLYTIKDRGVIVVRHGLCILMLYGTRVIAMNRLFQITRNDEQHSYALQLIAHASNPKPGADVGCTRSTQHRAKALPRPSQISETFDINALRAHSSSHTQLYAQLQFFASLLYKQLELQEFTEKAHTTHLAFNKAHLDAHKELSHSQLTVPWIKKAKPNTTTPSNIGESQLSIDEKEIQDTLYAINRYSKNIKNIQEKIDLINTLQSTTHNQNLKAILLWKISRYLDDIRLIQRASTLKIIDDIPIRDVDYFLSDLQKYCYPYYRLYDAQKKDLSCIKKKWKETPPIDTTLAHIHTMLPAWQQALIDCNTYYAHNKNTLTNTYEHIINYIRKHCRGPHRIYIKNTFTKNIFTTSQEQPMQTVTQQESEKTSEIITRELIKEEFAVQKAHRKRKKSSKKNRKLAIDMHAPYHNDDTHTPVTQSSTTEPVQPNDASSCEGSSPTFTFHPRVLIWHDNPHEALSQQGYNNPNSPKHAASPRARESATIKHRIPLYIEHHFRDLAIEHGPTKHHAYNTLYFPGAIEYPNDWQKTTGIFEIGFDHTKNNTVIHRFFRTNPKDPSLKKALQEGIHAYNNSSDETACIEIPPTYDVTIVKTSSSIEITDEAGITYILFKGHKK
jgi:hypothetical protein